MNKKEFMLFVSALRTYYPKENILPNEQAIRLWYEQLKDIPYKVAELALNKWVATNKWSPSISEIREQVTIITQGEAKDWGEAWESVRDAIRTYGSYQVKEAYDSMDEITSQVVRRLGFLNLCLSEDIQVERANFRMMYEQEVERRKRSAQLPPQLKAIISNMPNLLEGGD